MRIFKVGDKVRLIANDAGSTNKIGEIGIVNRVVMYKEPSRAHKRNLGHCSVDTGKAHWSIDSYFTDLELIPKVLNANTKVI
jgi:hypothetical protein